MYGLHCMRVEMNIRVLSAGVSDFLAKIPVGSKILGPIYDRYWLSIRVQGICLQVYNPFGALNAGVIRGHGS
jgi:hypothetical protein